MADSFYIGAYWGSRTQNIMEVTDKTFRTLQRLSEVDELFLNWYAGGNSRKQALERKLNYSDINNIKKVVKKSVKKSELKQDETTEFGFLYG